MDTKQFGTFIATVRKEKGMTQAELAAKLNVTDKAVSKWERGKGFPDINTLEPLANALELSILEVMRSQKNDMGEKNISEKDVVELMENAAEIAGKNRKQDKVATMGAGITMLAVAILYKLTGHASIGGALLAGGIAALAIIGLFYYLKNKHDEESKKIYGFFMLAGVGLSCGLLEIIGVDPNFLMWGIFAILGILVARS